MHVSTEDGSFALCAAHKMLENSVICSDQFSRTRDYVLICLREIKQVS